MRAVTNSGSSAKEQTSQVLLGVSLIHQTSGRSESCVSERYLSIASFDLNSIFKVARTNTRSLVSILCLRCLIFNVGLMW